jgi:hypothetical protein
MIANIFPGNRGGFASALFLAGLLAVPACQSGGHFSLCGYSTKPVYDTNIRTVYVPIFKNTAFRDSVRRTIEYDLTRKVIQQIESKTPYKVVSDRSCAD